MIFQRPQARVWSGSRSLEAGFCVAQSEAEIAELEEALRQRWQIAVAPGLLGQRFPITRERATTLAADNAGDENGGIANSELRNSRISHCGSSGA
jgi:hypothetical protein